MNNLIDTQGLRSNNRLFIIVFFFMSVLLHQSSVIFGVNISFADFFCFYIILYLAFNKQFLIPTLPMLLFMLVSMSVLVTALFYVPIKFMIYPEPTKIVSDFIKILAVILYFFLGYNLLITNRMEYLIKWYSIFGILIGFIGILFTVLNIKILSSLLFYGEVRFRGLMNDPNYFSVLQITALAYFTRIKSSRVIIQGLPIFIILLSVIVSGSKTGIITLIIFFTYRIIEYLFLKKKRLLPLISQLLFITILVLLIPMLLGLLQATALEIANKIPSFARIQYLFYDFGAAVSENGSVRDEAWGGAMQIIQSSPVVGIGIGTYMEVVTKNFHADDIAHNTLLQISAEWGLPAALVFSLLALLLLTKSANKVANNNVINQMLRDILIVLLIGSMAISLNNSRLLWLILGALSAAIFGKKINIIKKGAPA